MPIAFEVDDVAEQLDALVRAGRDRVDRREGRQHGALYARDPEGNILELQSWSPGVPSAPEVIA